MESQHREGEVATDRADDPTGAQDRCLIGALEYGFHRLFSLGFAAAVNPKGIPCLLDPIGRPLAPTEDEVGTELQHATALLA